MDKPVGTAILPEAIAAALHRPGGARFYKCALQVNPYEYVKRHPKGESFADEDAYNNAVLDALQEQGVEVIAITDHYRVKSGLSLAAAAERRGLHVFRGFEACSKEGVHLLCLFDPGADTDKIDRFTELPPAPVLQAVISAHAGKDPARGSVGGAAVLS